MIHDAICRLAEKRGMSLNQLAHKAGIHPGVISRWKKYKPSYDNLEKVAKALGVSVQTMMKEAKREGVDAESEQ